MAERMHLAERTLRCGGRRVILAISGLQSGASADKLPVEAYNCRGRVEGEPGDVNVDHYTRTRAKDGHSTARGVGN